MGLDLTAYICYVESEFDAHDPIKRIDCWDRLHFEGDSELFEMIESLSLKQGTTLPRMLRLTVPSEKKMRLTHTDNYGEPLRFVLAGAFREMKPPADTYKKNRDILAYLRRLDPNTRIVLYWH